MSRRLTPRGVERREQLMQVAVRLFADNGFHRTSVSEIVDACGVGKGVFYWYFDSKDELLRAALTDGLQELRRAQHKEIGDEADPVERVVRGIRATLDFLAEHRPWFRLFEFAATDADYAPAYRRGLEIAVEDTARHLAEAMGEGRIAKGDPYFLGHGVTTVTMYFFRQFVESSTATHPVEHADVVSAVVDFCLHGIGATSPALDSTSS